VALVNHSLIIRVSPAGTGVFLSSVNRVRASRHSSECWSVVILFRNIETSEELRPALIVALNTGMRKNEILSLRWRDVDFVKGFIHIADSKSGRSRDIPMNGLVFETLHAMARQREFVFENRETRTRIMDVKTAFHGACRRAEIKGVRFHDLRHTAASRMVEAGIDLVTVSKILGHSSIQMTMRYAHPTPENMRLAVRKLGEFFEKSGKPRSPSPRNCFKNLSLGG